MFKFTLRKSVLALSLIALTSSVWANTFVVKEVVIEGNERIGFESVNTYLPVNIGDMMTRDKERESLRALYRTGFFSDIALYKGEAGQLVIQVVERASIAEVEIKGNKLIKTDDFKQALTSLGISQGKMFNNIEMDRVIIDLKRQYHNQGYYAAAIEIKVEPLPRNRVAINIQVDEGKPASIERISLVGNQAFPDARLKGLLQSSAQVIIGSGDKYARPKLQGDLETLRSFYMDRGFAEFSIDSSQVSLSNDKTKVFISINMTEGPQYTLDQIKFSGQLLLSEQELRALANLESGQVFSRSEIIKAINAIRDKLSERGYAFAEVDPRTDIDADNRRVNLDFMIDPRNRVYVRNIEVEGNTRTRDHVLRREMRQYESAPYSLIAVRQSTSRLNRLGYFSRVNVDTRRVSEDEVDLIIQVEEQATGSFTAGIGYSQLDGVSFNLGISEKNLLGTGNEMNLTLNSSASMQSADLGYTNPYFTDDGVSLGQGIYYSKINAAKLNITDYTLDKLGVRVNLGYPTSELTRLNFGLRAEAQSLNCVTRFEACADHLERYSADNEYLLFTAGWRYDSRNQFYFPTKGQLTSISLQAVVPGTSDMTFYKVFLDESWFTPLSNDFTLKLNASLAYGSGYGDADKLPFFERFYAGGIGSVRGFDPNSLGGYYTDVNRPRGADVRTLTGAEIVFPMPLIEDSSNLRLSLFFDAGYVFDELKDVSVSDFRSATGLAFSWLTPVGPLAFSFSRPVHYEKGDRLQSFQFSLGMPF
ncbi:outer membrane protein assembly factor BamA [Thiomicrospira microaerophila]|uniref:outer membrane protein assembly factor BamA n=1 Tax=Thiomicrospira microaerophila TaxID=406020 RepID=UPI0005CA4847|nr:outer membrane protein assembly factor BamA [Thiomicrospira microaerophila]